MLPDYYDALDVPESASGREIEAAYWRRARDRRDLLPVLNEAIEVLTDKERRRAYDDERQAQLSHARAQPASEAEDAHLSEQLTKRWRLWHGPT